MIAQVTVLASFAKDKFLDERHRVHHERLGGPALFIRHALEREGIDFVLEDSLAGVVEIDVHERGTIVKVPPRRSIDFAAVATPYLLISTLRDEVDLAGVDQYRGKVFLDVQGYVRSDRGSGSKAMWQAPESVTRSVLCLRGTSEELEYIDTEWLTYQKNEGILLRTMGAKGCELFVQGTQHHILPARVVSTTNTVGAGDTFFASFLAHFTRTADAEESAHHAMERVSQFLALPEENRL
ncbi:MAG: PfkB family carbohydrate kinase [Patescibacteria group bacterium]